MLDMFCHSKKKMQDAQVNLTVMCSEWFFIMFLILYVLYHLYPKVANIYLDFRFHWVPCILLEWREEGGQTN